jgi:hypothetical protein
MYWLTVLEAVKSRMKGLVSDEGFLAMPFYDRRTKRR